MRVHMAEAAVPPKPNRSKKMSRIVPGLLIVIAVLAAACSTATSPSALPSPSAVASPSPSSSSPQPTELASPSTAPSVRPVPSAPEPTVAPTPAVTPQPSELPEPEFTIGEKFLYNGIHRDATDCQPVRDGLPGDAIAGIECRSNDPAVARIGFYLFKNDADMLDAYFARMAAEGVERDSGGSATQEGEAAYMPGDDTDGPVPDRDGVFVNAEGYANYRATLSGNHVYIGILGRTADMGSLIDFAWRGNHDVPGQPTLWGIPID
jgi:hypothetical protein